MRANTSTSLLRVVLVFAVPLSAACQKELPGAPSELVAGIVVYEHVNFEGASAHITADVSDLRDFKGPCVESSADSPSSSVDVWNDCISSVRVAPGVSATLYRDTGYRDDEITITSDMPDLRTARHDCPKGGLNDCVSSIRIRRIPGT